GAHVANLRIGHADELALVRRIGQHFLVSGHGSVEHHLAGGFTHRTECKTAIDRSISEGQDRGWFIAPSHPASPRRPSYTISPPTIVRIALPLSRIPMKGVLRLFERKRSGCTVHSRLGSTTVMSATVPVAKVPPSSRRRRAGFRLIISTRRAAPIRDRCTSCSANPKDVSRPTIPLAQSAKISATRSGSGGASEHTLKKSASCSRCFAAGSCGA